MEAVMRHKILFAALFGAALMAGPGLADEDCKAPMSTWQPRAAVAAKAESLGWKVRRIRTDDGCYKVYGYDAQGRRIEAEFDPETLDLLEFEVETDGPDLDDGPQDDDEEDHGFLDQGPELAPLVVTPARTAEPATVLTPLVIPHSTQPAPARPTNPLIGTPKAVVN
jgi:hypothetical protein